VSRSQNQDRAEVKGMRAHAIILATRQTGVKQAHEFQELLAGEFEQAFARANLFGVRPWLLDNQVT
jgi:hypothetical protein